MADINPNTLASIFEHISLETAPENHVLQIEYPVDGILPSKPDTLSLQAPANLSSRNAPPHDQRRLNIHQTGCYIRIPVTEARENPTAGRSDMLASQENAFASLTCGAGKSVLNAVTYREAESGEEILRLDLHVLLHREGVAHNYTFELSNDAWAKIVREAGERTWAKALDEIITRSTPRAYYLVRNRLICHYGDEFASKEEAAWSAGWGGMQLRWEEREETDVDLLLEDLTL